MSKFEVVCTMCGSLDVAVKPIVAVNGRPMVRGKCKDCGADDNLFQNEGPEDFIMPFGKFKGLSALEIVRQHRDYAEWLVHKSDIKDNIKKKFEEALQCS